MTENWDRPTSYRVPDVVPAPSPRRRRLPPALLGAVAAVTAAGIAGTAWAAASFLSGGGPQPEDALPASTVAMAKVDLDPSAGQKLAVFRLAQRFPSTRDEVSGAEDVREELLRALLEDDPDLDYARDVEPWIGDRAAVALVPVPGEDPQPLVVLAHTDRAEAEAALTRITADDPGTHLAFSRNADFALLSPSQPAVDAAASAERVLADDARFTGDVDALEGDGVVTAWADLGGVWAALTEQSRAVAADAQLQPTGRVAVRGRALSDGVEVVGRSFGLSAGATAQALVGRTDGTGMVADLPADTVAALSSTGLGEQLTAGYEQLVGQGDPLGVGELGSAAGLDPAVDLRALFGEETVVAAFGPDDVAARSRTADPDRAVAVVEAVYGLLAGDLGGAFPADGQEGHLDTFGGQESVDELYGEELFEDELYEGELYGDELTEDDLYGGPFGDELEPEATTSGSVGRSLSELPAGQLRRLDDGIAVGTSADAVDRITRDDGGLGRTEAFRRAAPDAETAGFVLFADLARARDLSALPSDDADLAVLEAVGATVTGGPDATFRLRLTVR